MSTSAAGQNQKAESLLAETRRERPEDKFIQNEIVTVVSTEYG